MKFEQGSIQYCRLEQWRERVGDRFVFVGPPRQKISERAQRRAAGLDLKGVFGIDETAFTGGRKLEGIAHDHIPHRRPVGIAHGARFDDGIPLTDWHFLKRFLLSDHLSKAAPNFADDFWQIPSGNGGQIMSRCAAGGALHEPPAVIHEVAPRPIGLHDL